MRGAAYAGLVMVLALSACDDVTSYTSAAEKIRHTRTAVIGTKWDQPGIGWKAGFSAPQGFDVDVARYIVGRLAGGQVKITWRESASSQREALLQNGTVDLVVASYSITPARTTRVTFAGPYVISPQDTLVRADDRRITSTSDLAGKRICLAEGSNSYRRITDPPPDGLLDLPATLVKASNYSDCVRKLAAGRLDAVSTESFVLAGYADQDPGKFRLLNDPVSIEYYGVGIRKGDLATCEAVNQAITSMWRDGTATRLLRKWFGKTGLDLPTSMPRLRSCR
ncbi:glutamate transport system substrate-binding protein [Nonomuraea maritima]|uniref:Glutamate transport system substrate-binding protein n=1 Tax=Nonomuraea maritima TaxID=683260 RepID=A0A1G8T5Q7_9ACTN|nr:glutamate ABC transporter substrate-binding protein [Nonomuraea maritima]SDJ36315.1 glutamate transport system substrate-binding protein [Nonomuraea maritima]